MPNFTCWIRIRILNADPDPGGDLNADLDPKQCTGMYVPTPHLL